MYRAVKMGHRWLATEIKDFTYDGTLEDSEAENLHEFITTGDVVLYGDTRETIEEAIPDEEIEFF